MGWDSDDFDQIIEEIMLRSTSLFTSVLVLMLVPTSMARTPCGPVCAIYCPFGNVRDANGCPTCKCKSSPCRNGRPPLQNTYCLPGSNAQPCPRSYRCVLDRGSSRGFCCSRRRYGVANQWSVKPHERTYSIWKETETVGDF